MSDSSAARVTVRRFTAQDEEGVVALWQSIVAEDPSRKEPRAVLARKLARDPELVFVACEGSEVVGTVLGGYDGVRGWIYTLVVREALRRQGIGTRLMRAVEGAIFALGCPKINLQVRTTNLAVVAFYEKLGYLVEERASLGKRREDERT
jgi:ribosomal protein S18 acetylase RimI-like enzyme